VPEPRRRRAALLAVLVALNLAGGLAMQWYVLAALGVGAETDALFAGLAVPQTMLAIIASSFMTVLVPLLAGESDEDFRRTAWTFAALTLCVFSVLAVALAVAAPLWVPLLVPGMTAEARALTMSLARVQMVGMVCTSLVGVLSAVQRARHRFVWTEFAPLLATVAAWGVLMITLPSYGVHAAAWVQVLRVGLHAGLLSAGLGRFAGFTRERHTVTVAWQRMRPLIYGTAYARTEPLVDRNLSSLGPTGNLSLYYLCLQVCTASTQLSYNALIAPLVPTLALQARSGDWAAFRRSRRRSEQTLLWLAVAAYALLILAGTVLVLSGFLPASASVLARRALWQLVALGGVLVAVPMAESLRTAYYATGNTAAPVRIDALVYTCGVLLKVLGFAAFGVWGLAAAASLQSLLSVFALRSGLRRVIPAGATPVPAAPSQAV
jgi:putative peptidoglycan lipid II flippase